jgi:hypothetical protein
MLRAGFQCVGNGGFGPLAETKNPKAIKVKSG